MAKTNKTQESEPEIQEQAQDQSAENKQDALEKQTPEVSFTGVFNGDSLSFEVPEGLEGTLTVKINEKPWGKAALQSPLTVVRGPQLPATHRIAFRVQPSNQ